jgi:hypothetical protein
MRIAAALPIAIVALAPLACGPVDTSSDGVSVAPDAGPVWTGADGGAGGGAPAADAGPADAGNPDAGAGDAGVPDAGTPDAGAPGGGATAACDGIVPSQNPTGHSVTLAHASGQVCFNFTSNNEGTVAGESHAGDSTPRWQLWSAQGKQSGSCTADFGFFGQPGGFSGTVHESSSTFFVRWSASCSEQKRTLLGGNGCSGHAAFAVGGGNLVLGGCSGGALTASRFDRDGTLVASQAVADTVLDATGLVDAQGRALVVAWPGSGVGLGSRFVGRWLDGSLRPTTGWFELPGNGDSAFLRPLIGGGAAMQASNSWVAVIGSGEAGWRGTPAWLASHASYDVIVIRQGRGYALVPKFGASGPRDQLELFSASGESCGSGKFQAEGLALGLDGTVIGSSGDGGCTMTWWPGILH